MPKKNRPYCPKCGSNENVEILSSDFGSWKCSKCKIRFEFSKLNDKPKFRGKRKSLADYVLDPTRREISIPVLDPSKKVYFEKKKNVLRITGDEMSVKTLLGTQDILPKLTYGIDKKEINKKGRIRLSDGTIEDIEF